VALVVALRQDRGKGQPGGLSETARAAMAGTGRQCVRYLHVSSTVTPTGNNFIGGAAGSGGSGGKGAAGPGAGQDGQSGIVANVGVCNAASACD